MSEPTVIYEDKNFLAVNKPSGWLTHEAGPGKPARAQTLTTWLLARYPGLKLVGDEPTLRPGIVHRLDRETSGIIIVPKTQDYFLYLKSLFQSRQVKKTYLALVWGVPKNKSGKIEEAIGIRPGTIRRSAGTGKMLKPAATEYRVIKECKNAEEEPFSLLEIFPLTGRTHQIRVHLKHIGHPILGDSIYGRKNDKTPRLMLHALSLEFEPREGEKIKLEAAPPDGF